MSRSSPDAKIEELPLISADTAVRLLGISCVQFHRLVEAGFITVQARNRYHIHDVVGGFLQHLSRESVRRKTARETSRYLDLSERRFFELIDAGMIDRADPAVGYDFDIARVAYIRYLRKIASGHGGSNGKFDLATERAALAREQRLKAARENAIAEGQYVAIDAVGAVVESEYMVVREHFLGLPGKEADALSFGDRDKRAFIEMHLRDRVHEILSNLSDPETVAAQSAAERIMPRRKSEKSHANAEAQHE